MSETVSSAAQWMRSCSLVVADMEGRGIELSGPDVSNALRIVFHVEQEILHTPKSMRARVYNLSAETVQEIYGLASKNPPKLGGLVVASSGRLVLKAGYRENFAQIFVGNIYQMKIGKERNVDSYLDLYAADGDLSHNFAVMQMSLSKGYTAEDAFRHTAASMQPWGTGYAGPPAGLPNQPSPRGRVFWGMSRDIMDDLALTYNSTWAVRDGTLEVTPKFRVRAGEAVVVNAHTGMIGTPEMTEQGIRFTTLLNPALAWGSKVLMNNSEIAQFVLKQPTSGSLRLLTSPNVSYGNQGGAWLPPFNSDGQYVVLAASHTGDTRGDPWWTECICLSANPSDPIPNASLTVTAQLPPPLSSAAIQGPAPGVTPP